jgi:hypothetical protein
MSKKVFKPCFTKEELSYDEKRMKAFWQYVADQVTKDMKFLIDFYTKSKNATNKIKIRK